MTLPPESPAIAPMRGSASRTTRNFTGRCGAALVFADTKHHGRVRKGTDIPYVSHLVSVTTLHDLARSRGAAFAEAELGF